MAKVYFSKEISPETVVRLYGLLGIDLPGKVAVKVHSGDSRNTNSQDRDIGKELSYGSGDQPKQCC